MFLNQVIMWELFTLVIDVVFFIAFGVHVWLVGRFMDECKAHQNTLNKHTLDIKVLRKRLGALEKSSDHSISFGGRHTGRSATSLDKIISELVSNGECNIKATPSSFLMAAFRVRMRELHPDVSYSESFSGRDYVCIKIVSDN
jgi:hypothetical protein